MAREKTAVCRRNTERSRGKRQSIRKENGNKRSYDICGKRNKGRRRGEKRKRNKKRWKRRNRIRKRSRGKKKSGK